MKTIQFKERRETFWDSLTNNKEEDKKKTTITTKHTDISMSENGVPKKTQTFSASHCRVFGGEK
jgi:hypothetical protein